MRETHRLEEQRQKDKSNHDKELQKTKDDTKMKIAKITDKTKYEKKYQYDAQSFVAEYLELKRKSCTQ